MMREDEFRAAIHVHTAKQRNFLMHVYFGLCNEHARKAEDVAVSMANLYHNWMKNPAFKANYDIACESVGFVAERKLASIALSDAGNVKALIFLLKGRMRDVYGDKQEIITTTPIQQHVILGPPPEDAQDI